MARLIQLLSLVLLMLAAAFAESARGDALTDGSAGAVVELTGRNFEIPASLGTQRGANLFQSFERFGIDANGSATFTPLGARGPIDRVIVRVTGGTLSQLDGRLDSTIGERSFLFINPAGLAFGSGGTLDLHGAFHASTANSVRFDDGFELPARLAAFGEGGTGSPVSLRFTTSSPAPISVAGTLATDRFQGLSLVGGGLDFASAQIATSEARLALVSVGSPGEVRGLFDPAAPIQLFGFQSLGAIHATDSLFTSTAKTGFESSFRESLSDVDFLHPETSVGTFSYFFSFSQDLPDASMQWLGNFEHPTLGTVRVYFTPNHFVQGAGDIFVRGSDLHSTASSWSALSPGGPSGEINVAMTGDLFVDRGGSPYESGFFTGGIPFGGDYLANVSQFGVPASRLIHFESAVGSALPAGDIHISARNMTFRDGAGVSSVSYSSGAGGNIYMSALGDIDFSGIGPSGVSRGLFSSAEGSGDAGDIYVRARDLRLERGSAIIAQTTGNADAGDIALHVERLSLRDGAVVDSTTSAQSLIPEAVDPTTGNGGDVTVDASRSVSISGHGDHGSSELSAFSRERTTGRAGSVEVATPYLEVTRGGQISVRSSGAGESGRIFVAAGNVVARSGAAISAQADGAGDAGEIEIRARDSIRLRDASISTAAPNADGGNVTIRAGDRVVLEHSEVTASVGGGKGGNIEIDPRFVVLNASRVVAQAGEGTGGSIRIAAAEFLQSVKSVISATSNAGVDGTVQISAPDSNLSGELTTLSETYLDASALIADRCALRRGTKPGSFVQRGRGGTPDTPAQPRPAHYRIVASGEVPVSQLRGDRAAAIAYWSGAVAAASDSRAQADALLELAQAFEAAGDAERAGAALTRAQAAIGALGQPRATAAAAGVHARLRARAGDAKGAASDFQEILAAAPPAVTPALQLDYANLLDGLGQGDEAAHLRALAEALAGEHGDPTTAAQAALARAESPEALEAAARRLLALPASNETLFAALRAARLLAEQARERSSPELRARAAALFAAAAESAEALGDPLATSYAWGWLGGIYEDDGRPADALELTRRAVAAAQRAHAPESLYLWQWQLGRIALAQGDLSGAQRALRAASTTLSGLRANFALGDVGQRAVAREFPVEPVVRALVDVLLRVAAQTEHPAERNALLLEARARLEDLNADELQDYLEDECVATERHAAPESVPGSVVIYPAILDDRLELIVSAGGETRSFVSPVGAAELSAEIRRFRVAVQDRNSSEYLGPAIKLYDWLIRPIEPELERLHPDTLVFVSTGSLRGVPLGALRDALDGTFLVEKYALAIAPGLTLTAPRPLGVGPTPALKAGLSESVQGYPALASVPRELASVDALFPGPTLLNERFVESQLEQTLGSDAFGIVHIASHAEFHGGIDDAFIVTFDGKLGMKRLAQLVGMTEFRDQPLELLALSACQTAAGDERAALGLAGVAVKAGARSTLASLWYIEDEAAGKLMAEFYAGLAKPGVTRAAALQRAQLALLSDPKFRHPVTWAPFLLIGSWQ